jgi:hypothetical protein
MVTGDGYDRKGGFALGGLNDQDGRWLVVQAAERSRLVHRLARQ